MFDVDNDDDDEDVALFWIAIDLRSPLVDSLFLLPQEASLSPHILLLPAMGAFYACTTNIDATNQVSNNNSNNNTSNIDINPGNNGPSVSNNSGISNNNSYWLELNRCRHVWLFILTSNTC
jgi:hypothetical protein